MFLDHGGLSGGHQSIAAEQHIISVTDRGNGEREATQSDARIYIAQREMANIYTPPLHVSSSHACRSVGISTGREVPDIFCLGPYLNQHDEAASPPFKTIPIATMANDPDMVPCIHARGAYPDRYRPLLIS